MKENKYDNDTFFNEYRRFPRSVQGLQAAGEWHELKKMFPDFTNTRVLDIGCGFGWHCIYAAEHGASQVLGTDISYKMLEQAKLKTTNSNVIYQQVAMEDMTFEANSFDIIISSLAFHYTPDIKVMFKNIYQWLSPNGTLVFSVEHPVFTAQGKQDWYYADGNKEHWPVDNYFLEGQRTSIFLGEEVTKYHKTLTTYLNGLLETGFHITKLVEPKPEKKLLDNVEGMKDELRRPMMLLISAKKGKVNIRM